MVTQLDPITPGEILRDERDEFMGLSQNKLALGLNTSVSIVNRIVNNKLRIRADMALRLGKYFGTTAQFWMNCRRAMTCAWPNVKRGQTSRIKFDRSNHKGWAMGKGVGVVEDRGLWLC